MAPFIFFLIPFNFYLIEIINKFFRNKYYIKVFSIFIIFCFSYFNFTYDYLSKYFFANNIISKNSFFKNYAENLNLLKSELLNCENALVSYPTFILSNSNLRERNIYSLGDLPPFGIYKSNENLIIYNNMEINCILLDNSMVKSSGNSRGTGTDFEIRRKNYLFPFMKFNEKKIVKINDLGNLGKLYIY
jgi:hypothetical protein